jgi:hypothetical protein
MIRSFLSCVFASAIVTACVSSASDADLVGTWANDDAPATGASITLTIMSKGDVAVPANEGFDGELVGKLAHPAYPKGLLVDVRRDPMDRPYFTIPIFDTISGGNADILCEGCNLRVSNGVHELKCTQQPATVALNTGGQAAYVGQNVGLGCNWTKQ